MAGFCSTSIVDYGEHKDFGTISVFCGSEAQTSGGSLLKLFPPKLSTHKSERLLISSGTPLKLFAIRFRLPISGGNWERVVNED
jgi:hypothetical protein